MRKFLSISIVVLTVWGVVSGVGLQAPQPQEADKKVVDMKSDLMGNVAYGDTVVFMVGNFAAQHNGTVITCDSAVRYSDSYIECFGNVLINKNTTYIYGDRADYNGETNIAHVYSEIVKVVDGDATLYTREFFFNTKENIGTFSGGGVMINRENVLEAVRGYYYSDLKELVAVSEVEMRNDEYELKGDSVVYNIETDNARFFERTNIWNRDGDYLYADRGAYLKADTLYKVTKNGYVLTEKQEMWSDSIDYYRTKEHVQLWRDVQIDDTEHKVLAFGDHGEYWKEPGNAILTRRPSVVSYDTSEADSLFMCCDSIFLFTINKNREAAKKAAAEAAATEKSAANEADSLLSNIPADAPVPGAAAPTADGQLPGDSADEDDAAAIVADSLAADSMATDSLALQPTKAQLKEASRKAAAEKKRAAAKAKKEKLDAIAATRRAKMTAKLDAQKEREEKRLVAARVKAESKLKARQAKAERRGKKFVADSTELLLLDSLLERNKMEQDSLMHMGADSLATDSLAVANPADSLDSLATDSLAVANPADSLDSLSAEPADSIYRLIKGYRNVRIYRTDFQAVCDSLTAISTDSTMHMYIAPVLWNEGNQITSDIMDFFTASRQLVRAEFVGNPMMVTELDTLHYNQISGKQMTAHFRNSEIYRNDVKGNVQTIYYMQDGEPQVVVDMFVIDAGDASFYIEEKQVVKIVYRNDDTFSGFPLVKVPETQEPFLKGFKWQGGRRPSQADVFDRRVRPSEREMRLALPHPTFPIRQRMDEQRKELIQLRRWAERNEKVDQLTVEWMRKLGYEVGQPRPKQNK